MADSPEIIRQQMSETRAQIAGKLETLEQQVSDTVQSTGSAVHATVGAVQETVQTVTGAVQDAVESVGQVFDLGRHVERHPWLILGGAMALGYLSTELMQDFSTGRDREVRPRITRDPPAPLHMAEVNGQAGGTLDPQAGRTPDSRRRVHEDTVWSQLTAAMTGALVGIVNEAATRVVPEMMDYFSRSRSQSREAGRNAPASNGAGHAHAANSD